MNRHAFALNRVSKGLLVVAVAGAMVLSSSLSSAQPAATVPATTVPATPSTKPAFAPVLRPFPGTKIRAEIPGTWLRTRSANGYRDPTGKLDIAGLEIPAPYAATIRELGPGGRGIQGFTVDRRDEARIEGRDAMLIRGTRSTPGGVQTQYWLLFGTAQNTIMLTARYPSEREKDVGEFVRTMLLSARWMPQEFPDPVARLPFTISIPEFLKASGSVGDRIMFTEGGVRTPQPTKRSMQVFVGRLDKVPEEAEARKSFEAVGAGRPIKVIEFKKIKIAGLDGYEGIADVTATPTVNVTVCLLQLYDGEGQYNVFGQCLTADATTFVPLFKAAGRSIKLIPDAEFQRGGAPVSP